MKIRYNTQKLEQIVNTLFTLTGISIAVLDTEYNYICKRTKQNDFCVNIQGDEQSKKKCVICDQELLQKCKNSRAFESHICHAGLFDAVTPIIKNEKIVGYVIMGRVRVEEQGNSQLCLSSKQQTLYNELPFYTSEQVQCLKLLVEDILFENAITVDFDPLIDSVAEYIKNNLASNHSISQLCSRFCISKNYLYNGFARYLGVTVNDYIINLRIEKAKQLLNQSDLKVYQVCEQVGIDNYTYFCKMFKKRTGYTPKQFKDKQKRAH